MSAKFTTDPLPAVNNGERHVAVALANDVSGSMTGAPVNELNEGMKEFKVALQDDKLALGRAEITVIKFESEVETVLGFRPAAQYEAPEFSASGLTAMNGAINASLDALEERKQYYRDNGIDYYRPWFFLLTDGAPTDTELETETKARLQEAIRSEKVVYIPMGIGNADIEKLREYYPNEMAPEKKVVLKADATNFKEAFQWLSSSISTVSHSDPTTQSAVQLPPLPSNIGITVGTI